MSKKAMGSDGTKPSKKATLEQLLQFKAKLPSHSQSALQAFIEQAKEHGLPDLSSSNHQREAREHLLEQCHGGQLGPLLQQTEVQTTDGSSTTMFFIHLLLHLTSMYHLGGSFSSRSRDMPPILQAQQSHGISLFIVMRSSQAMSWAGQRGKHGQSMPVSSTSKRNSTTRICGSP